MSAMKNQDELGIRRFIEVSRAGGQLRGSSPSLLPPSADLDGLAERFKKRGYAPVVLPRKFTLSRVERVTLNDYSGSMRRRHSKTRRSPYLSNKHRTYQLQYCKPDQCALSTGYHNRPNVSAMFGFPRTPASVKRESPSTITAKRQSFGLDPNHSRNTLTGVFVILFSVPWFFVDFFTDIISDTSLPAVISAQSGHN